VKWKNASLNVLELIDIARVPNVKLSALTAEIEG
jgi:hypothetical protein